MPWFPVDDAFHSHPKAKKAGDEALGMWTRAGAHCMAYLTDGFIPDWWVKEQPRGAVKARRLVEAGLWRVAKKNGEQGFQFHDWKPWCTKHHVEAARENARQRKARSRESRVTDPVTDRVTDAVSPWPYQSNPIHTSNSLVTSGGELTQVAPAASCPRHPSGTDKPCGACADARRANDNWRQAQRENELTERRKIREARESCTLCDENGMRPMRHGLVRCNHTEAVNE